MTDMTVAEVLESAASLIEREGAWTRKAFARDAFGHPLAVGNVDFAVCWCMAGAVEKVSGDYEQCDKIWEMLEEQLGVPPSAFNDAPERTQAEVVAALRASAAKVSA